MSLFIELHDFASSSVCVSHCEAVDSFQISVHWSSQFRVVLMCFVKLRGSLLNWITKNHFSICVRRRDSLSIGVSIY